MPRTPLPPSKRLYLRNLPRYVNEETLLKHLSSYGKIVEVKIIHDYAFVQFDLEQDARDVVETFRSQPFLGQAIIVEFARPLRKDMPSLESTNGKTGVNIIPRPAPENVQSRYPIVVTNIPRKVRWQELKDFGRMTGALVAYCDLDKKRRGRGFIEYFSKEDAHRAIQELDGRLLGGKPIAVSGLQESYVRSHHPRSRSPQRCGEFTRQRSSSQYTGHSAQTDYPYKPAPHEHHHHTSPPSSYNHHNTPTSYHYSQHQLSRYYPSPPLSSPTDHVSIPDPPAYHPATTTYRPTGTAYLETEEQYDYTGHSMRLDSWKYDYDYDQKYEPHWERSLQVDHREYDYYSRHL